MVAPQCSFPQNLLQLFWLLGTTTSGVSLSVHNHLVEMHFWPSSFTSSNTLFCFQLLSSTCLTGMRASSFTIHTSSLWQSAHNSAYWDGPSWRLSTCPKSTDPVVPAISSGSVYCKSYQIVYVPVAFPAQLRIFTVCTWPLPLSVYVTTCPVFSLSPSHVVFECGDVWRGSLISSASSSF